MSRRGRVLLVSVDVSCAVLAVAWSLFWRLPAVVAVVAWVAFGFALLTLCTFLAFDTGDGS